MFQYLLAALSLAAAAPQEPAPQDPPVSVPDVTVNETRYQTVRNYVQAIPVVNRPDEQLARFDRWVCPAVANLAPEVAQAILDRITRTAVDVGLRAGEPGCSPNVVVVFSLDADQMAADLREERPNVFDDIARTRRSGRTQLREFLESDAPVRWWHSTEDVAAGGSVDLGVLNGRSRGGSRTPKSMITGTARARPGSLLISANRMNINMALVIVDMNQIEAADLNALADYAAFVALGQIDPHAEVTGSDTILNLFGPEGRNIREMSAMDRAYLRALYSVRVDATRASQQQSDMVAMILRDTQTAD